MPNFRVYITYADLTQKTVVYTTHFAEGARELARKQIANEGAAAVGARISKVKLERNTNPCCVPC